MRYYELVHIADPNQNISVFNATTNQFHFGTPKSLSDCNAVDSNAQVISLSVGMNHEKDKFGMVSSHIIPVMQVEVDSI